MTSRRLRVHYVIPSLSGAGGAERSLAALAPGLVDCVDLSIITLVDRRGLSDSLRDQGVRVEVVAGNGRISGVQTLRQLLGQERPDLVHTTLWDADVTGRLAAASLGIPTSTSLVNTSYGPEMLSNPSLRPWKVRGAQALDALTARTSVRFHALTDAVAEVMSRRLLIPRRRIDVIPRGRSEAALGTWSSERRDRARRALGLGDGPVVVAAARHEWQKGLDVFVEAARRVDARRPGVTFLLGGEDGAQSDALHEAADSSGLGDRLRFIGQRDDLAEVMCAADVFCVPSRWEGFASILAELMALGVPTVASDIPPIREVAGGTSWARLATPDDPTALAEGICTVLSDPGWRVRTAPVAQQRFRDRYRADVVAEAMVGFFDRAAAESRWERVSGRSAP